MANARMVHKCQRCNGDGIAEVFNGLGQPLTEDPCTLCGGDGIANSEDYLDTTDIMDRINDLENKLNDIDGSISDINSRTETILDVVNDIHEHVG